jgi:hypothetical protein
MTILKAVSSSCRQLPKALWIRENHKSVGLHKNLPEKIEKNFKKATCGFLSDHLCPQNCA